MRVFIFPVLLQVIGILVIMAEIFIPSFGLLSVIALALFSYSLYLIFTTVSLFAGLVALGFDLIAAPLLFVFGMKILARSPLALKQELSREKGVVSQGKDMDIFLNQSGISLTDLRPAGVAKINDIRMDVVTDGEYIEAGTPVVVRQITGNRVVVQKF